ncbi:hypothetical protein [Hyphomicrobium sp. DY-1]|uniref:hypothetical protein n=1 Tax=Hyphomicrobium sp. DY-1 TaxID=3075650 RepID=UPI0039C3C4E5
MSAEALEARVGAVEREQAIQGERLTRIEHDGARTLSAVEKLVERDARRPHGLTWKEFFAGFGTALTLGGGLWWAVTGFVEHSPAVVQLERRMDQAEWKAGWAVRVDPN